MSHETDPTNVEIDLDSYEPSKVELEAWLAQELVELSTISVTE